MTMLFLRRAPIAFIAMALTACGGGGGSSSGGGTVIPTEPTDPPDEITDAAYADLSDRGATGTAGMAYVALEGTTVRTNDAVQITYDSGAVSGDLLAGTNIDDPIYLNPANGEFSRIVQRDTPGLFGAIGLDVQTGDLPTTGTTEYNEGWVGMTAILENGTYVLTGDATFEADWDTSNVDGRFFNLTGTLNGSSVGNQGAIILTGANIVADDISGGRATGEGIFAPLNVTGAATGTFFGPDADELGGVLEFNDTSEDIRVLGAFQAD